MAMAVNHGLVGPKLRLKGVGDGQQVNIPAPVGKRLYDGVTQKDRQMGDWKCPVAT